MKLSYSEAKALVEMTDKESVQAFVDGLEYPDTNYQIFTEDDARERVYDMYRGDDYMLGSFNPWFIADYVCLDTDTVETLQKSDAFEGIGRAIMSGGKFEEMMDNYIRLDGFGHALSSYDGNHEAYTLKDGSDLIIIRIN